ncbi:MAG: KH domain-containing protein, partial [Actinobacteria bacterium]|nr:KH domain-containing protein [Actinomycetota bacterium]
GDRWVADRMDVTDSVVIVNKLDIAKPKQVLAMLQAASALEAREYFPVSATSGEGIDALVEYLISRLPPGPKYFPDDEISDLKGMVIGKGGLILKQAGERARAQLPEGVYLELRVKVDKDWQRRAERVERLGY